MSFLPHIVFNPELLMAKDAILCHDFIHKFGEAGDIDTADNFADIWDGATDSISGFTGTPSYTYSTSADIDSVVSSSTSDTTDVEIQGLNTSWERVTQTVTLNGRTRVALTTDLIRVFRMKNVGSSVFVGNVFCYVDGELTVGVPNTEADVRAIIQAGNDQTLMALYTIAARTTGYLCSWYASISKKKNQNSDVELRIRSTGEVFQLKHRSSILAGGTSRVQHIYHIPEVIPAKADITLRADSSADNGAVSGGFDLILVEN